MPDVPAARFLAIAALGGLAVAATTRGAAADPVADHFRGKSISVIVGYDPGGGYDVYTRLLTRFMSPHTPGNPAYVIQHMPGAGSLRAANYIANVAPKDGTTLGVFSAPAALEPMFGNTAAQFDPLRLTWVGNMFRDTAACGTWANSGIASLQDIAKSDKEIVFGATGPGSYGNQHALVLKDMLGLKLKVITGYKGVKDVGLALQRGEIQVACAMNLSTVKAAFGQQVASGELRFIVQFGKRPNPYFAGAPSFYSMIKGDEQNAVADLFFEQVEIARPVIGPPDMPPAVVAALRKAMWDTIADKGLREEAARLGLDIDPVSGEDTAKAIAALTRVPPPVIAKAKAIMGR